MPRYTLNRNAGVDTLHQEHPWEQCNVDEATDVVRMVEDDDAFRLVEAGDAVTCKHCLAEGLEL